MNRSYLRDPTDVILGILLAGWCALIFSLGYFPTQDGPSHVYNAFVLSNLSTPPYSTIYESAWTLVPNLAGTALLIALGSFLPWMLAEKTLVMLCSIGFVLGTRYLCRSRGPALEQRTPPIALLAIPFALSAPLFYGFYSYNIGLALVPWIWALAPKTAPTTRIGLAALCTLCWFAHAAACMVAIIGAVILGYSRHWRHLSSLTLSLLPAALLLGWYALGFPADESVYWDPERLAEYGVLGRALFAFDGWLEWVGVGCAAIIIRSVIANRTDTLGLLNAAAMCGLFVVLPDGGSEHWFLSLRLSMLPLFALLVAASNVRSSRPPAMLGVCSVIAAAHLLGTALGCIEASKELDNYVELEAHVPDGAYILSLDDLGTPAPSRSNHLLHASAWLAVHRVGVDITNYEPHRKHFQLRLSRFAGYPEPNQLMDTLTSDIVKPFLRYSDTIIYRTAKPLQFPGYDAHETANDVHVLVKKNCKRHPH